MRGRRNFHATDAMLLVATVSMLVGLASFADAQSSNQFVMKLSTATINDTQHEWKVWKDVKLPDGKILIPGVISHSTILVEHPELVAERIVRYANVVGRENVIAGSDCGFATFAGSKEVHPSIVWAKFKALSDGARIASKELWG